MMFNFIFVFIITIHFESYRVNNRRLPGQIMLPGGVYMWDSLRQNYLQEVLDPDGNEYGFQPRNIADGPYPYALGEDTGRYIVSVFYGASCGDGSDLVVSVQGGQRVALVIPLESGGHYCLNN
jgi:hypothetical protein